MNLGESRVAQVELHPLLRGLLDVDPRAHQRLSWDDYFMALAVLASWRSPSQKLQVGAVLVRDGRVLTTGYNGYIAGAPQVSVEVDGREVNTIHAEQNAITYAARNGLAIDQATVYSTHYPCLDCTKALIAGGVRRVVYLHDHKNNPLCEELFRQARIPVLQVCV
jgi:dCMP deaminase